MKNIITLLVGSLMFGSFVSGAAACMDGNWSLRDESTASVAQNRVATVPHVSARTLKKQVRANWKNITPAVKGF